MEEIGMKQNEIKGMNKNDPGAPGLGRKTASDFGNPGNVKMKKVKIMTNKWRVNFVKND